MTLFRNPYFSHFSFTSIGKVETKKGNDYGLATPPCIDKNVPTPLNAKPVNETTGYHSDLVKS